MTKTWSILFAAAAGCSIPRARARTARARVDAELSKGASSMGERAMQSSRHSIRSTASRRPEMEAAAAVRSWRGVRSAKEFAPICPQRLASPEFYAGLATRLGGHPRPERPLTTSEDCLYLNI